MKYKNHKIPQWYIALKIVHDDNINHEYWISFDYEGWILAGYGGRISIGRDNHICIVYKVDKWTDIMRV